MLVRALPARFGDCLLVQWGSPPRALMIDAGVGKTYTESIAGALARCRSDGVRRLELLVVTHLDRDHIGGVEQVVKKRAAHGLPIADVWFNGAPHIPRDPVRLRSVEQAEALGRTLQEQNLPWNAAFGGKPVRLPSRGAPAVREFDGGLRVTVLSPDLAQLRRLAKIWPQAVRSAESPELEIAVRGVSTRRPPVALPIDLKTLAAKTFAEDTSEANGSSIALLIEHEGRAVVLTGDAYPSVVLKGWRRLVADRGEAPRVDVLKLSHHGSHTNTSPALLRALKPKRVLISTDGSAYGHPHAETLAWAIKAIECIELVFNHDNEYSQPWASSATRRGAGFKVRVGGPDGVEVEL
jgi:beta-lactamase superfamily II metal-dependent hydrolase